MGRPRKPTALKIAEGDQPCRINRNEPSTPKGLGPMPDYVADDPNAAEAWGRLVKHLDALGILQEADAEAVAHYCQTWSLYAEACEAVREHGLTVATTSSIKTNPAVHIRLQAQRQLVKLLTEFGMTPASRSGLDAGAKTEDDPLMQFLAGKLTVKSPPDAKAKKASREKDAG